MLAYLEHTNCRGLQLFLVDTYMWLCWRPFLRGAPGYSWEDIFRYHVEVIVSCATRTTCEPNTRSTYASPHTTKEGSLIQSIRVHIPITHSNEWISNDPQSAFQLKERLQVLTR